MSTALRQRILFSLLMSLVMSTLMSGWVTFLNLGLRSGFLGHWRSSFLAAWPVAFLVVVTVAPSVQRLSSHLLQAISRTHHNH